MVLLFQFLLSLTVLGFPVSLIQRNSLFIKFYTELSFPNDSMLSKCHTKRYKVIVKSFASFGLNSIKTDENQTRFAA